MQDSVENVVYAVGDAFVSSSLGTAELIVAFLVAVAFAVSAVQTVAKGRDEEQSWKQESWEQESWEQTWHDRRA